MSPGDVVKVRLQCQTESRRAKADAPKPKYRGPVHCLLSIIKEDGVAGLYRGALPLMLRDGPSYALYFLTYSTACEYLTDSGKTRPSESSRSTRFASFHIISYCQAQELFHILNKFSTKKKAEHTEASHARKCVQTANLQRGQTLLCWSRSRTHERPSV